jgi:hypothetical protein
MARALWFAGIAAAAAGIAWILSHSVRRAGRKENPEDIVAGLRKKLKTSPRAFLEGAEKVLVQMAEAPISIQYQETYQCLLSHCRISLEEYRYSRETLPGAAAENLIEALGELLRSRRGL